GRRLAGPGEARTLLHQGPRRRRRGRASRGIRDLFRHDGGLGDRTKLAETSDSKAGKAVPTDRPMEKLWADNNETRTTDDPSLVVDVAGFEGPLDLLPHHARNQKVDLARISVLALAEQYLVFIETARKLRLELAADYLVMAAWLP